MFMTGREFSRCGCLHCVILSLTRGGVEEGWSKVARGDGMTKRTLADSGVQQWVDGKARVKDWASGIVSLLLSYPTEHRAC
jgi:hypothetical protein